MGDVHTAFAGHQEFAAGRRHGVVYGGGDTGLADDFGSHQAGRAGATMATFAAGPAGMLSFEIRAGRRVE
ncbi:hypothetical protein [Methylomonas koyamae]|uniref:hypothetical protein n=1 Tax=Methylomonas koyamae TaxID=702114 RepID=UPI002110563D|nr:hypothetical protein [Methylomonas koyamae]